MIRLDGVTKTYPDDTTAVDDLSLVAPKGRITALVGPSGCGKTTTLRMINRMIEPTAGTITVDGQDVASMDAAQLRRDLVGMRGAAHDQRVGEAGMPGGAPRGHLQHRLRAGERQQLLGPRRRRHRPEPRARTARENDALHALVAPISSSRMSASRWPASVRSAPWNAFSPAFCSHPVMPESA